MSHRLVRCLQCDLVYVPLPPGQDKLAAAYHVADYDSTTEADDAADAYMRAIQPILAQLPQRETVLEIGTGTAIFLERLQDIGFTQLVGVEPSTAAIAVAPDYRRAWIHEGIFEEAKFLPESFDLICCFMTMEHVVDPSSVARSAWRLLRPGGAFVTVTHDWRSVVNRVLGKRSPIIDIEHMQLFCKSSLLEMFARTGYERTETQAFANRYALRYWFRLAPIPTKLKTVMVKILMRTGLDSMKISANVGNTVAAGFKPR
jgi:SAM-dependent methyltransferase